MCLILSETISRKNVAIHFIKYTFGTISVSSNYLNLFLNLTITQIFLLLSLTENESAFDLLYCITFKLMDHQWLTMRASYMDFNVCLLTIVSLEIS